MQEFSTRKNIRLAEINYRGRNRYFVTFCCFVRRPVFSEGRASQWLLGLLRAESARLSFRVHACCLMPDHLHFLSEGLDTSTEMLYIVKSNNLKSSRTYAGQFGHILSQKGFYEHILRAADSIEDVAWYIWLNPVRKGIVQKPDDFAYSGSFTGMRMPLEWTKLSWQPPWKSIRDG